MNTTKSVSLVKSRIAATLIAIVAAVILPQLVHTAGKLAGLGNSLGEMLLPMHLPVILAGILAGPVAGAVAGAFSPLISYGLSGMPGPLMLPFMMIELCSYGFVAGIINDKKLPMFGKVLVTQLSGRAIKAAAILVAAYVLKIEKLSVSIIYTTLIAGIPGILIQWAAVPLLSKGLKSNDDR